MRTAHFLVITQRVVVITTRCVIAEKNAVLKMGYCSFLSAYIVSLYWSCTQRNTMSSYQCDKANFIVPEKVCCTRKRINVIPIHRHCLVHCISPITSYPQFLPYSSLNPCYSIGNPSHMISVFTLLMNCSVWFEK